MLVGSKIRNYGWHFLNEPLNLDVDVTIATVKKVKLLKFEKMLVSRKRTFLSRFEEML